jgi:hypothetical protein
MEFYGGYWRLLRDGCRATVREELVGLLATLERIEERPQAQGGCDLAKINGGKSSALIGADDQHTARGVDDIHGDSGQLIDF